MGFPVALENFPDPDTALESSWIPYIHDKLAKGSEKIILIGHSSGAVASMRYLEKYKAVGCILVSAYWTDLGMESEAISNYFSRPWNFKTIGENAEWIVQFGSTDDPFIPVSEMRHVSQNLSESATEFQYIGYEDKGHYISEDFPDLIKLLKQKFK